MANEDVLSARYATRSMNSIFSPRNKVLYARELWIAVMRAQRQLGLNIPQEDIQKYESAKNHISLAKIKDIEKVTKHDVKAMIEEFVQAAGAPEHVHKGMTSRDITDNIEQMQNMRASRLVFGKYISVLRHMCEKIESYDDIVLTARTHHQPAQPTLLGRRFSMWAEELLYHLYGFEHMVASYPLRGIKGPVGTQADMLTLLGSSEKVDQLEDIVAEKLGFGRVLDSPGQVYPRSMDYSLISGLSQLASACQNFAKGMRLMAGYELVTEGFKEGQTGSSAMPHKMNTRSSERICGLGELVKMYADGASRLSGDQWEEGDVSCSVVRRVILPGAFYATDGLCETALTVLDGMGAYPVMIGKEADKYLQFLATTQILVAAVQKGMGREEAHKTIKRYAVAEAIGYRDSGKTPDLVEKLCSDPSFMRYGISQEDITQILDDKTRFVGNARAQMESVLRKSGLMIDRYRRESRYEPKRIL